MTDAAHMLLRLATGHRAWHSIFILPVIAVFVWVLASACNGAYGGRRGKAEKAIGEPPGGRSTG